MRPVSELIRSRGDDDVHALGGADVEAAAAAGHRLDVVGPDAGAVDDDGGPDLGALAGLDVLDEGAHDALAGAEQLDDASRGDDGGAVGRRGAHRRQRVPGVVGLGVVVEQAAGQRVALEGRGELERAGAGQLLVARHGAGAAHRVVERQPGRDVGPLPAAVGQRVEEGDRLDEVRGDAAQHELALLERLAHEVEVHLLEVAQAAVEELGRPGRRAGGEVALLDEGGRQATRGRVEGDAAARHAASDDEHVEVLGGEALPRLRSVVRVQPHWARHRCPFTSLPGVPLYRAASTSRMPQAGQPLRDP